MLAVHQRVYVPKHSKRRIGVVADITDNRVRIRWCDEDQKVSQPVAVTSVCAVDIDMQATVILTSQVPHRPTGACSLPSFGVVEALFHDDNGAPQCVVTWDDATTTTQSVMDVYDINWIPAIPLCNITVEEWIARFAKDHHTDIIKTNIKGLYRCARNNHTGKPCEHCKSCGGAAGTKKSVSPICQCSFRIKITCTNTIELKGHHTGHIPGSAEDVSLLRITPEMEAQVMKLIYQGRKNHDIFREVNEGWFTQTAANDRRLSITLYDIQKLRQKYKKVNQIHSNDSVAMHLWVSRQRDTSKLLYYAWRDEPTPSPSDMGFCSIIMTDGGVIAMDEWGKETAFMDTTYGVTRYGYGFTALVVKDSHSNHWPVAFMLHRDDSAAVYTTFLREIKRRTGFLPKSIVTDISDAEIKAIETLDVVSLLCYFHLLQAIERNLRKHIHDRKERARILNMIRLLKNCRIESEFRIILKRIVNGINDQWPSFVEYFTSTYICGTKAHDTACLCNARGWANIGNRSRFPLRERDETTNLIERFFKAFKYDFLDRRNHRRLSDLHLIILNQVIPHYLRDMMLKKAGRIVSTHQQVINRRQRNVKKLLDDDRAIIYSDVDTGCASVLSEHKKNLRFLVCLAEMRCTCPFAVKRNAICKHLESVYIKSGYNNMAAMSNPDSIINDVSTDMSTDMLVDMSVDAPNETINGSSISGAKLHYTGLHGGDATEAAVSQLQMMDTITIQDADAQLYTVQSIITTPTREYFVDLHHRLCSCLHSQIYNYCPHLLHVADVSGDLITATALREEMDLLTVSSINIDYWRNIGREDRLPKSELEGSIDDSDEEGDSSDDPLQFKSSSTGIDTAYEILRLLPTMEERDQILVNERLLEALKLCRESQVAPLIDVKQSISHRGNRQDTDRSVKTLHKSQSVRPRREVDSDAPTIASSSKRGRKAEFEVEEEFQWYRELPNASLSENLANTCKYNDMTM